MCGSAYTYATMTSQAFLRLRGMFARLKAGPAGAAGPVVTVAEGLRSLTGDAGAGTSVLPESPVSVEDPARSLEAALTEGLDEVRQYLGVLRRQNIAMSIKVARTERRLEDLSARLEACGCHLEAAGEDRRGDPAVGT